MQRSPFYANRMFDSKYNVSALPTFSNSIINIDKLFDKETGKVLYKERRPQENLYTLNDGSVKNLVKDSVQEKTDKVEEIVTKNVVNEIATIAPHAQTSMNFSGYLQEFIKNSSKDREYIFSPYFSKLMKYSNTKVYENAELLETKKNFTLEVQTIKLFVSGGVKNNTVPVQLFLRYRFLCKVEGKGKVLQVDTPMLEISPTDHPVLEFYEYDITKQLPDSQSILYAAVPSVVVRYDEDSTCDVDLSIKTRISFRYEKV